jgi:DNA-binding GntR family transcriptional regulator
LSLKEIRELFEIRAEIESDLLRRAIPEMGTEDFGRASEILVAYDSALRSGEVAVWGALNWQFHSTLYAPADRALSMGIVSKLHQHSDRYLRLQLALTHGESRARQEHRAILTAVKKRDTAKACQFLRDHILGAGKSLVSFLETTRGKTQHPILYPIPRNRISR